MTRAATFLAIVAAVMPLIGCGGGGGTPRIPISGTVEMDGKPLTQASLAFLAGGGAVLSTAITDNNGNFTAKVGAGANKVSVSKVDPEAAAAAAATAGGEDALMGKEDELNVLTAKPRKTAVPARYADPATSGLAFDIQKGMEPIQISLLSK